MKISYRQKLFLYFSVLFVLFTISIIVFERVREKKYKTQALEEKLEAYTDIIHAQVFQIDSDLIPKSFWLQTILPNDLRITLINNQGKVLYDNSIDSFYNLNNHIDRPEIIDATNNGKGSHIRLSNSNQHKYLYFAKKFDTLYIRVALPYNIQLQQVLQPDNVSLYFILLFFIVFLFFIHIATSKLGKTIRQLRDYVLNSDKNKKMQLQFPNDEIGEIGSKIADNYFQLKESKRIILLERQKLLQHIQVLEEGICFLSFNRAIEFHNGLFIQNLNNIIDYTTNDASIILSDSKFQELQNFFAQNNIRYFENIIHIQGKIFSVRAHIFEDNSSEIILTDVTKKEKTKQLKQEMTGNIAHELRTPITSIRGYLETVLNQHLDSAKQKYFIERAFQQTLVLSEIIQDMSLITKMEEAHSLFSLETINVQYILIKLKDDLQSQLLSHKIEFNWYLPNNVALKGNSNLLYALFRNLTENVIRYAGENVKINVSIFKEDTEYYYFSYFDTGKGIQDEIHLSRIFERFYRIGEGRTRELGGSGLGLSIVKNAVQFHGGKIIAKNRKEGGLEFLFTLKKEELEKWLRPNLE
jgi:two-component system phosphate regulon sensor histidine kinase PhoR